jgi:hypothetical protein
MAPTNPEDYGWTVGTLYVHFDKYFSELTRRLDERISAVEKAAHAAGVASDKAVTKAEAASEKRLDGMNEFRETLADQQAEFRKSLTDLIARPEVNVRLESSDRQVSNLSSRVDRIEAKGTGLQAAWGILIGVITVVALILGAIAAFKR